MIMGPLPHFMCLSTISIGRREATLCRRAIHTCDAVGLFDSPLGGGGGNRAPDDFLYHYRIIAGTNEKRMYLCDNAWVWALWVLNGAI